MARRQGAPDRSPMVPSPGGRRQRVRMAAAARRVNGFNYWLPDLVAGSAVAALG